MKKLSLPPGFRFHPTDAELVSYYLKRKVSGRKLDFNSIGDVELYKYEPWDLPDMSLLQTRDLEWYFFCPRDRKYPNGSRTNRATEQGYWKATGKDRPISSGDKSVGMKKTLVYYKGRAPKGERTNWVIHEYRLNDAECEKLQTVQNGFVLCRLYKKSGAGPKNGEQYGAPVEDEVETANAVEVDAIFGLDEEGREVCEVDQKPANLNMCYPDKLELRSTLTESRGSKVLVDHLVDDHMVNSAYGQFLDDSSPFCAEESGILQQLLDLAACNEGLGRDDNFALGYSAEPNQADTNLTFRDGDFLELDDLQSGLIYNDITINDRALANQGAPLTASNARDINVLQPHEQQGNANLDHSEEMQCKVGLWEVPAVVNVQMPLPVIDCGVDSNFGTVSNDNMMELTSDLYNQKLDLACQEMQNSDYNYDDILELFGRSNALSSGEKESIHVEGLADNIQRGMGSLENLKDKSRNTFIHDGPYYDALPSFPDLFDFHDELSKPVLNFLDGALCEADLGLSFTSKVSANVSDVGQHDSAPVENRNKDMKFVNTEGSTEAVMQSYPGELGGAPVEGSVCASATDSEKVKMGLEGTQSSKAFSIICNCLGSIQGLPASAADLSPRIVSSVKSISVMATSVDFRAVTTTCSCAKDDCSSPCANCASLGKGKKRSFVRSFSLRGQKSTDSSNVGFYTVAFFGVIWAFFWLLILGGAWKLFGGVYRLVLSG